LAEENYLVHDVSTVIDQATGLRQFASLHARVKETRKAHVISVVSGKGGVGKSTLALNLGYCLGSLDKRVLIIDADTNLGSLDVMAGVSPNLRLDAALRGECGVMETMIDLHAGVTLIAGSSGDPTYIAPTDVQRQRFVEKVASYEAAFDFVVLDTGAGIHPEVISYATLADEVVVVTTPESTAIVDAYAVMKVLLSRRQDLCLGIVVNNARSLFEAEETMRKLRMAVQHFLGGDVRYLGPVLFDPAVRQGGEGKSSLACTAPASAAGRSFHALAMRFVNEASGSIGMKR
jgi:flagellar biosynthesis protein FlhG